MKRLIPIYLALMLGGLTMLSSCIRDETLDCPPLRVTISVKDKNYSNVDKVDLEDRKPEDSPMIEFVPTLYWVLRDVSTGDIVEESDLIKLTGDERQRLIETDPNLPHGKYVFTVWGGLEDLQPLGDNPTTIDFHPGNMEGRDIYMTNDTLLYDAWHSDYTVELERTKGKLIIEKVNLPTSITGSEKKISGLYAGVSNEFKYSGETQVNHSHDYSPASQIVTKTVLSPSMKKDGSSLGIDFLQNSNLKPEDNIPKPKNINITMKRNELTVVRYVWDEEKKSFSIYILIEAGWQEITKLDIID